MKITEKTLYLPMLFMLFCYFFHAWLSEASNKEIMVLIAYMEFSFLYGYIGILGYIVFFSDFDKTQPKKYKIIIFLGSLHLIIIYFSKIYLFDIKPSYPLNFIGLFTLLTSQALTGVFLFVLLTENNKMKLLTIFFLLLFFSVVSQLTHSLLAFEASIIVK